MSKGDTFENDLLKLIFNNTAVALVGDASGLQPSAAAGFLYVSLHTGDVGEAGVQTTSEAAYTGYSRIGITRTSGGWTVTNNTVAPTTFPVSFPACTGGTATVGYFAVGTSTSGAGKVLYKGSLSPVITVTNGITPQLASGTYITED